MSGLGGVDGGCIADIAPSPLLNRQLQDMADLAGVPYVGIDFDPSADSRVVTLQASLTQLPLRDASVGLMICFHVLEHIPDDRSAMEEIHRVLAPDGVALIQVPWRRGEITDEDPGAPVEVRLQRFGQADHVRYYGSDFDERLERSGLTVTRTTTGDVFEPWQVAMLGTGDHEPLWLCTAGEAVVVDDLRRTTRAAVWQSISDAVRRLADERDQSQEQVRHLQAQLKKAQRAGNQAIDREKALRRRFDVRVVSAVRRAVKKLLRRGP